MASNINSSNIDGTYPVAGQDNDSQGFRTNFTNIKNNFTYAKSEIEDLQAKAIVKSALSGVTINNNMAGTQMTAATIKDFRETVVEHGTISGSVALNHASGHYHSITTSGSVSISFAGFTADVLCKIRLEITVTNVAHTLTLPSEVTYGLIGLKGVSGSNVITFDVVDSYILEFTTYDGGVNIHVADMSRTRTNPVKIIGAAPAAIGTSGDVAGMIRYDSTNRYMYVCVADYNGTTKIWHKSTGPFTALT